MYGKNAHILKSNLLKSFILILKFYGLSYQKQSNSTIIIKCNKQTFKHRAKIWLTKNNHHYLRITRILKSLIELGLFNESIAFYKCFADTIYPYYSIYIGSKTLSIWKKAFLTHTLIKKTHSMNHRTKKRSFSSPQRYQQQSSSSPL